MAFFIARSSQLSAIGQIRRLFPEQILLLIVLSRWVPTCGLSSAAHEMNYLNPMLSDLTSSHNFLRAD